MYYPIIDKLKEIMTDITSVKDKEPLVIDGTVTDQSSGTWAGNWNDIVSAFNINKPVYFSITDINNKYLIPVVAIRSNLAVSGILYSNSMMVYGVMQSNNNFYLLPIQ